MFGLSQKEKNYALQRALSEGHAESVKKLLDKGADPNLVRYNYGPALFVAIEQYKEEAALACVQALLDKKASVSKKDDSYGRTALHFACYRTYSHLKVIKALIDAGADLNAVDRYGNTPLMTAVNQKGWQAANLLLDYCARDDKSVRQVLITAISQGAPESLLSRMMEKLDINIDSATNNEGITALHAAVTSGNASTVEWVLKQKADIEFRTHKGIPALQMAVANGRADLVKILLDKGANPNVEDNDHNIPLVIAARNNSQEIVDLLVRAKADLGARDSHGLTALTLAAGAGSIRTVMALLSAAEATGAKLALEPAMFAAAERGAGRVLELLIGAGADVNARDEQSRTPLMRAVSADQIETLSLLIKAGAKPDMHDQHGMSAYDHAVASGKAKAKDYLTRYRHETVKTAAPAAVAEPSEGFHYQRVNDHSLEVREGDGLTMTFNFWTQQVIIRDTERPAPVTVQNFSDIQRQEAIDEAYAKLKELGGNPPDPHVLPVQKKAPGLK